MESIPWRRWLCEPLNNTTMVVRIHDVMATSGLVLWCVHLAFNVFFYRNTYLYSFTTIPRMLYQNYSRAPLPRSTIVKKIW